MKKKLTTRDIIYITSDDDKQIACWNGNNSIVTYKELLYISPNVFLFVIEEPIVFSDRYWLHCLHPEFGPITLDPVDYLGYETCEKDFRIKLCE